MTYFKCPYGFCKAYCKEGTDPVCSVTTFLIESVLNLSSALVKTNCLIIERKFKKQLHDVANPVCILRIVETEKRLAYI